MRQLTTRDWGYKILSSTSFNFYHSFLGRTSIKRIAKTLTDFKEIEKLDDGSITVYTNFVSNTIGELERFIRKEEKFLSSTLKYSYKIEAMNKKFINEWLISLEGCIALILLKNCFGSTALDRNWHILNSKTGGLYISPYTILFYEDHASVIHPIRINNMEIREQIEKEVAVSIRGIMERVSQAQEGYEGLALVSYVEYKTGLTQKEIVEIINEKSFQIRTPRTSPLFKN